MSRLALTPEQQVEADRIAEVLMEAARREVVAITELLASKPDNAPRGFWTFTTRPNFPPTPLKT